MKPGQVYEHLLPTLQKQGAKQVLLSMWGIDSPLSPAEIRDWLRPYLDVNDRLIVIELTDWAAYRTMVDLTHV